MTRKGTCILGISAFYHDSAACLLRDGAVVAAAQEERFTRRKHDASFPVNAVRYCLEAGGVEAGDLDHVGFYDKPLLKFMRLVESYLAVAPRGIRSFLTSMPLWLKEKLHISDLIRKEVGFDKEILYTEHHESHAASAFFPSPFREAAILTIDGVGEWTTASIGIGRENTIRLLKEIRFPHSLGLLYSAFTYFTGFKVNSGEYKMMGLAPYGEPRYRDLILDELIDLKEDGSFKMNMRYFDYIGGLTMTSRRFDRLFGGPPRVPESKLTQREMDIAASIQSVTEEIMLRMARTVHRETGCSRLCLAGGVALNCVGNGRILREGPFEDIFIQPAAGDAGGALGVALFIWHQVLGEGRAPSGDGDAMGGAFLGPEFGREEIASFLERAGAKWREYPEEELIDRTADLIAAGRVVGWFQGRMEFGPRALGARSILGDPRSAEMQSRINLKIKFRESFRPFAPSVLEEEAGRWFDLDRPSPYMLLVAPVSPSRRLSVPEEDLRTARGLDKLKKVRSAIPAVTHVDYSARIQTVSPRHNPRYHRLISRFRDKTGCPLVVNTSFNVRGEPIVCTPRDAYRCFMRTGMDDLVLFPFLLKKEEQAAPEDATGSKIENFRRKSLS